MYGLTEYVYPGQFYDGFFKSVMNTRTTPETPIDTMCQFGVSFFYTLKALRCNAYSFLPLQYVLWI